MIRSKLFFENIKLFFLLIVSKIGCDYSYSAFISVIYSYQNFTINTTNSSQLISWIIFILLSPFIIKNFKKNDISSRVVSLLTLVSFLPTLSMINHNADYHSKYIILITVYWLILHCFNIIMPNYLVTQLKFKKVSKFWFNFIIISIVFSVLYISWKFTGFRLFFDIVNVYGIRAEAQEYSVPIVLAYLSLMADNILPLFLVYFLIKKKKIVSFFIIFLIFLNFSIHAAKSVFFLLILSLISVAFVSFFKKSYYNLIYFNILLCLTFVEKILFETAFSTLFFSYRILFIPAKLNYVYFDFFNNNELDFFRQSFFKFFKSSPYSTGIDFMMAVHDTGDFTARGNNGLFSDAFYNFGTFGVITFPIILIFLFKLIDGPTIKFNNSFKFITSIILSIIFLSLPFSTALFSSGFVLILVLFYLIPKNQINN